jgi:PAS domain S-box-containing protein
LNKNITDVNDFIFEPSNYNILIVDDSKSANFIVGKIFRNLHYNCFNAFNLKETRDILNTERIDYMILDIHLPDGNGFEIIQELENTNIKIFVLTGDTDKQFRDISYQKGIIDFIEKKGSFLYKVGELPKYVEQLEKNKFKTILIVDDSIVIQQQLKALLENRNYNVKVADDAPLAWSILKESSIDLMLLDLELRTSNGLEFLVEKRLEIVDQRKIPVMIVSGLIDASIIRDGLKAGAVDVLSKPYIAEEVMLKVDAWIDYRQKEDDILRSKQLLEQYKLAVDKNAIVSKSDPDGKITYVNDKLCAISEYTQEELVGKQHNILRDPLVPKELFEDMWQTIKDKKKSWVGELSNISKNGNRYWISEVIQPIVGINGDIIEYIAIRNDISDQKKTEFTIRELHKHTKDSIEYASLIQGALIPKDGVMDSIFKDNFVTWIPKDTVGGDIWLFEKLRHEDECLLLFIDCTGHGVPGAFVTMIVKSIEREIVAKLRKRDDLDISPAIIMEYFNKTMKMLLRQEDVNSLSNVGFDGGIIYYNRRTQILKFAGAETPLFYIDENGEYKTIKGNRYSVGYKKCDANYKYKETILNVKEGMKFYCTTDGFLDQNGGEKDFPFGKKRFGNIIRENYLKDMKTQQAIFLETMSEYEAIMKDNFDRNDDMTIIGFEIKEASLSSSRVIKEITKYEGLITQAVLANCLDSIEVQVSDMNTLSKLSVIVIEYCQNIINYGKNEELDNYEINSIGEIDVRYINDKNYELISINTVSLEDKQKIKPKLQEIQSLDKQALKKRYRELRKSGQNTHEKGGGIGMYEIAKISDSVEYEFTPINKDKYTFMMKVIVLDKKDKR